MREIERLGSAATITIKVSPVKRDWMQAFALFSRVTGESLLRKRIEQYIVDTDLGLVQPFTGSRKQEIPANAVSYNVRVERDSHARFVDACERNGITPSLVIRNWIDEIASEAISSNDCVAIDQIRRSKAEKAKPKSSKNEQTKASAKAAKPAKVTATKKSTGRFGLFGRNSGLDDQPVRYIQAKDFKPGFPNFESICSKDGGYPIYASWVQDWTEFEAVRIADLDYDCILALIDQACIWSIKNPNKQKAVSGLNSFLNNWIMNYLNLRKSGDNKIANVKQKETRIDRIYNAFAKFMVGAESNGNVIEGEIISNDEAVVRCENLKNDYLNK